MLLIPVSVFLLPRIKFPNIHIHLNTWAEKGTVRVNCPAQEHNTVNVPDQDSKPDISQPVVSVLNTRPPCLYTFLVVIRLFFFIENTITNAIFYVLLIALHVSFI